MRRVERLNSARMGAKASGGLEGGRPGQSRSDQARLRAPGTGNPVFAHAKRPWMPSGQLNETLNETLVGASCGAIGASGVLALPFPFTLPEKSPVAPVTRCT